MTVWPQSMRRKTAAQYLDMSEAAFVREVASGRLPSSFMLGAREHWRKDAIDAAIAALTGDGELPDYRKELQDKLGRAA